MELNSEHKAIIDHTIYRAANNLYCGGGKHMDELCDAGYMEFAGKTGLCPDPYYRVTAAGRKAVRVEPTPDED